jgi:hypothetical protein
MGSPRSGTTLLYHMLLSAGDFAVYHTEAHVFNMLSPRFGGLRRRSDREEMLRLWFRSEYFRRSGLQEGDLGDEVLNNCHNGGDFLRTLMDTISANQGARRWAECTPENLLYVDEIKKTIPDALIIHIIRDGRDVALSMRPQGWARTLPMTRGGALVAAGAYWEWIVEEGRKNLQRYADDTIEIRFENLIENPTRELARLGSFICHDLDYARIQASALGSVSKPNSSFGLQPHNRSFNPLNRWKSLCTREELGALESIIGDLLGELGYERASTRSPEARMRLERRLYRMNYGAKNWLKGRTPLGKYFTDVSLLVNGFEGPKQHSVGTRAA